MSCPAVEYGNAMKGTLNARLAALWEEIESAGVSEQAKEVMLILAKPENAYTKLQQKRRLERNSFTG